MFHNRLSLPTLYIFLLLALLQLQGCVARSNLATPDKEGILLVAFGTSQPAARTAFATIEAKYKEAFPNTPIEWAFTSHIIRNKLIEEGKHTATLEEGLRELVSQGVNIVRVQSLHIMSGEDFSRFARALILSVRELPHKFKAVYLGLPLLDSRQDAIETARALQADLAQENKAKAAVILMGHGQRQGRAGLTQEGAQSVLHEVNPHFYLATVEGEREFAPLLTELKKQGIKKLFLAPFMLVAGEHAREDMAGADENSWANQLEKAGYTVLGVSMKGLGEREGIADIFIRHTRAADENILVKEKSK